MVTGGTTEVIVEVTVRPGTVVVSPGCVIVISTVEPGRVVTEPEIVTVDGGSVDVIVVKDPGKVVGAKHEKSVKFDIHILSCAQRSLGVSYRSLYLSLCLYL